MSGVPIHEALYDLAHTIVVGTIWPMKEQISSAQMGPVVQAVYAVLTKELHAAGFVRIEHIPDRPALA